MRICDYGCGQEAKFPFKNGKWCCSKYSSQCKAIRQKVSDVVKGINHPMYGIKKSTESKLKNSETNKKNWADPTSIFNSKEFRKTLLFHNKLTIKEIIIRHPFFSKIEEIRYNPNKPTEEKEIQVHCKNHNCKNSKEKGGWFTPTAKQFKDRKDFLENEGVDRSGFYCSQHCKDTCILFGLQSDPLKENNLPYTPGEIQVFNKLILNRDNEICHYCGEHTATIVHHLRPQKLEPFFALDPDYAVSVCAKCHYKHGHPIGSKHSTGNLAKIVCSVESQKFLNQKS